MLRCSVIIVDLHSAIVELDYAFVHANQTKGLKGFISVAFSEFSQSFHSVSL